VPINTDGDGPIDTTAPLSTSTPEAGVFSFTEHDLCEWVTGEEVAEMVKTAKTIQHRSEPEPPSPGIRH